MILTSLAASAFAERLDSRVVLGADLSPEQISSVYNMFSINRGDCTELTITNAEEREYLEGYVDSALIGTRSVSCVYVELLSAGEGMSITTSNINWCTPEMYISALATAGISDARIEVAAPAEVSGTAALTGIYKAYEDMTGQKLDDIAKLEAAYYYVLDNSDYIKRNFYEPGTTYWAEDEAYFMLKTGYGNCYCYAASFYELARALGFDARIYSGYMGQYSDRHGWVEIEIDGENYFFDPQLQMSCWDREEYEILFMVDEAHAHKWDYDYE